MHIYICRKILQSHQVSLRPICSFYAYSTYLHLFQVLEFMYKIKKNSTKNPVLQFIWFAMTSTIDENMLQLSYKRFNDPVRVKNRIQHRK